MASKPLKPEPWATNAYRGGFLDGHEVPPMVSMLAILVIVACIALRLWGRLSVLNVAVFMVGMGAGCVISFSVLAGLAMANPITTDPGAGALNSLRLSFMVVPLLVGLLGGVLAIRCKYWLKPESPAEPPSPGFSP